MSRVFYGRDIRDILYERYQINWMQENRVTFTDLGNLFFDQFDKHYNLDELADVATVMARKNMSVKEFLMGVISSEAKEWTSLDGMPWKGKQEFILTDYSENISLMNKLIGEDDVLHAKWTADVIEINDVKEKVISKPGYDPEFGAKFLFRKLGSTTLNNIIKDDNLKMIDDFREAYDESVHMYEKEKKEPDSEHTFKIKDFFIVKDPVSLEVTGYTVVGKTDKQVTFMGTRIKDNGKTADFSGTFPIEHDKNGSEYVVADWKRGVQIKASEKVQMEKTIFGDDISEIVVVNEEPIPETEVTAYSKGPEEPERKQGENKRI